MRTNELREEYFKWMYSLVCTSPERKRLSYKRLLKKLYDIPFVYSILKDSNRLEDGISLRYRFGQANDISQHYISESLDDADCSVLEMLVALALRLEEETMDSLVHGNRTGIWFWIMLTNMKLGFMNDANFKSDIVEAYVDTFLNRTYERDGTGGIFTTYNDSIDMRDIEIWYQMMHYLNENIDKYR